MPFDGTVDGIRVASTPAIGRLRWWFGLLLCVSGYMVWGGEEQGDRAKCPQM